MIEGIFLIHIMMSLTHLDAYMSVNRVSTGSDNGSSPIRRHVIIKTNTGLLPIEPLRINFSEIVIKTQNFSFMKIHPKVSSAMW